MDRNEFIFKSACMIMLGGAALVGCTAQQADSRKKFKVITQRCDGCGHCYRSCRDNALIQKNRKAFIDVQQCKGCGECTRFCRRMAIVEMG